MDRHRSLTVALMGLLIVPSGFASVQGTARQPRQNLPSDRQRRHVQTINTPASTYTVPFNGAVDGAMTRMPISYAAYKQGWQPNLYCRVENVGDTDVINPWLTVNGLGDWRTVQKIADEATRGCATDGEKARAIWEWERKHRFHACTWDAEVSDAVKVHNVYGYTLCGNDAQIISDMFKAAGLQVRRGFPVGHCVTEAFYEGEFHLLDGDEHVICLRRDNKTIASEAEVVRDHDLMKRTHTYSIGAAEDPLLDQFSASLYGYEGERKGEHGGYSKHTMLFSLRPGESLEWRWDHVGKEYSNAEERVAGQPWRDGLGTLNEWGATAYDNLRNGKWTYRVPLDGAVWRKGIVSADNAAEGRSLRVAEASKPAVVVWKLASPWVFVGAQVRSHYTLGEHAAIRFSFSPDNKSWSTLVEETKSGAGYLCPSFDQLISPRGKPMYQFFVRLELQGAGSAVSDLLFDNDVQMSLLGMPELIVGGNKVQYTDETPGPRQVKITHAWLERTEWQPPTAPASPLFPADGATVEGTQFTFKWSPAQVWSAGPVVRSSRSELRTTPTDSSLNITDYHIEVCERPDMRWVISPNFDKLTSHTPSKGGAEWTIPFVGLLNPGTTCYWRVRAMDSHGVWGPWSQRWSFRCQAPGVPLNVRASPQSDGSVQVRWEANVAGRKPVAYKVYGSDEQGFTASDTDYIVRTGRGFCDTMDEYNARARKGDDPFWGDVKTPANLVTKTEQTSLAVVGPAVTLPNTNKAFYRVVAVDERGNESGPSDYVAVPRPFFFTATVTAARVGQEYRYMPRSIRSIGHFTCNGSYNGAFWHREKLAWSLEQGPQWLRLENGVLTGTPPGAGKYDVVIKVTNNRQQEARQAFSVAVK